MNSKLIMKKQIKRKKCISKSILISNLRIKVAKQRTQQWELKRLRFTLPNS